VWVVVLELRVHGIGFAFRLLEPWSFGLLLLATVGNILVFAEALYLRAHKQEKFMLTSVLGALWMAPATIVFGRWYGSRGITVAYLLATVVVGIGLGTWTFAKYRREWHG
jgi:hypothetical protein